jgi:hypothetical protein
MKMLLVNLMSVELAKIGKAQLQKLSMLATQSNDLRTLYRLSGEPIVKGL